MSKSALILLPSGVEEMEIIITADVLRRAGVEVTIAGLAGTAPVVCSRKVVIVPDADLETCESLSYDAVILPGGLGGMKEMSASPLVGNVLKKQEKNKGIIAAICAAPIALATHGIALGKSLTSYPSFKEQLQEQYTYVVDKKVVQDGNLITSQGPATAFDFGLKLASVLVSNEKAAEVAKGLLYEYQAE